MSGSLKEVGIIIGETSSVSFDFSSKPSEMPSRWEYLMIYSEEELDGQMKQVQVIAQIERVMSASQALTKELNFEIIKKIIESGLADGVLKLTFEITQRFLFVNKTFYDHELTLF